MMILLFISIALWIFGLIFALINSGTLTLSRICLVAGTLLLFITLCKPFALQLTLSFFGGIFQLNAPSLWLIFFGLISAFFSSILGGTNRFWLIGLALSLIGSFGVFTMQSVAPFVVSWELMSFGGAIMIIGDQKSKQAGGSIFFMLALLEVGAVFFLLALLSLSVMSGSFSFDQFAQAAALLPPSLQFFVGVLFLLGFGAKLGLLPFYEWFPETYGSGSGASGALFSGLILNAALYALARALLVWLPPTISLGIVVIILATLSAIIAILYGFQQEDWRKLLSLSSAENASIAILMLGLALLFHSHDLPLLAGLCTVIAFLHMAAHTLAKGCLFFTADAIYRINGSYAIKQNGILKRSITFGIGALIAAMSLAAMPPQAGFLSEWYSFQSLFHGYLLMNLPGQIAITIAAAGLALSSAIAIATFIKLFGIGLMGKATTPSKERFAFHSFAIFITALVLLALAAAMPIWIRLLTNLSTTWFGVDSVAKMHTGWLMVPLSKQFAFSSPPMLMIALVLFAIIPILLLMRAKRFAIRHENVWFGGRQPFPNEHIATTPLVFSNAVRTFFSAIYKPVVTIKKHSEGDVYFTKSVDFKEEVTPFFTRTLFTPIIKFCSATTVLLQKIQSGNINLYNGLIAILLILILCSVFF